MKRAQALLAVALAACGGNVVVDTSHASSASSASGAGAAGTGGVHASSSSTGNNTAVGGSPVTVASSVTVTDATSSTNVTVGTGPPPPCVPCSALFFQGADPSSVCPGMEVTLMKTMEACVCQSGCASLCADLCQANGPITAPCKGCTLNSAGGGCFMAIHACSNG
jgi:hypothetical protein